jgi:hypothetical protein
MTSRQNVSLSWMRSVAQSRFRAAASSAPRACGHGPGGEEIEVFRRPCREVLREQGRSPGQQKSLGRGQAKEQPGHLELEVR